MSSESKTRSADIQAMSSRAVKTHIDTASFSIFSLSFDTLSCQLHPVHGAKKISHMQLIDCCYSETLPENLRSRMSKGLLGRAGLSSPHTSSTRFLQIGVNSKPFFFIWDWSESHMAENECTQNMEELRNFMKKSSEFSKTSSRLQVLKNFKVGK